MAKSRWLGETVRPGLVYSSSSFREFPGFRAWLPETEALPLFLISTDVFLSDPELCKGASSP